VCQRKYRSHGDERKLHDVWLTCFSELSLMRGSWTLYIVEMDLEKCGMRCLWSSRTNAQFYSKWDIKTHFSSRTLALYRGTSSWMRIKLCLK
jgi:hypothetical protein